MYYHCTTMHWPTPKSTTTSSAFWSYYSKPSFWFLSLIFYQTKSHWFFGMIHAYCTYHNTVDTYIYRVDIKRFPIGTANWPIIFMSKAWTCKICVTVATLYTNIAAVRSVRIFWSVCGRGGEEEGGKRRRRTWKTSWKLVMSVII